MSKQLQRESDRSARGEAKSTMVTVLPMGKVGREAMAYHHASCGRCASVRSVPVLMTRGKWSVASTLLRRSHCCAVVRRAAVSCCVVHVQVRVVEMFHHAEPWRQTYRVRFRDLNKIAGMAPC